VRYNIVAVAEKFCPPRLIAGLASDGYESRSATLSVAAEFAHGRRLEINPATDLRGPAPNAKVASCDSRLGKALDPLDVVTAGPAWSPGRWQGSLSGEGTGLAGHKTEGTAENAAKMRLVGETQIIGDLVDGTVPMGRMGQHGAARQALSSFGTEAR
jgi:hypothetical protein